MKHKPTTNHHGTDVGRDPYTFCFHWRCQSSLLFFYNQRQEKNVSFLFTNWKKNSTETELEQALLLKHLLFLFLSFCGVFLVNDFYNMLVLFYSTLRSCVQQPDVSSCHSQCPWKRNPPLVCVCVCHGGGWPDVNSHTNRPTHTNTHPVAFYRPVLPPPGPVF